MLFVIDLPGIKALWFWDITVDNTFLKRLASTFAISLYRTLHKLIGLYYVIRDGFFILGISAICLELIAL
jgi:hypothetical protein